MRSNADYVNNNDHNLVGGFDESTCPVDSVCDIFNNEDDIITEDFNVCFNANKATWQERVIKIPFSHLPQDSNHLKLMWIGTKKDDRALIKKCSREYKKTILYQPGNIRVRLKWRNLDLISH